MADILVVDDNMGVQSTIRILLELDGHRVSTASDGRKGLALFGNGNFDLLILDIFMPGMDGFETMRSVRQTNPKVPIIVISGENPFSSIYAGLPDYLNIADKLGAVETLRKPFKPAELRAAVERSINRATVERAATDDDATPAVTFREKQSATRIV